MDVKTLMNDIIDPIVSSDSADFRVLASTADVTPAELNDSLSHYDGAERLALQTLLQDYEKEVEKWIRDWWPKIQDVPDNPPIETWKRCFWNHAIVHPENSFADVALSFLSENAPVTKQLLHSLLDVPENAMTTLSHNEYVQLITRSVYTYLRDLGQSQSLAHNETQEFVTRLLSNVDKLRESSRQFELLRTFIQDLLRRHTVADHPFHRFDSQWARSVLELALARAEERCDEDVWSLFTERVLLPIRQATSPPPYAELATRYQISSPRAAALVIRAKHAVRNEFSAIVSQTVSNRESFETELSRLREVLSAVDSADDRGVGSRNAIQVAELVGI